MTAPDPTAAELQADAEWFLRAYELPVSDKDPVSAAQRVCRAFLAGTRLAAPRGAVAERVGTVEVIPHDDGRTWFVRTTDKVWWLTERGWRSFLRDEPCNAQQWSTEADARRALAANPFHGPPPATADDAERLIALASVVTLSPLRLSTAQRIERQDLRGLTEADLAFFDQSRTLAPAVARKLQAARERAIELAEAWRAKAVESREEAGRIRRTIKDPTDAESRCLVRAEVWDWCADELAQRGGS